MWLVNFKIMRRNGAGVYFLNLTAKDEDDDNILAGPLPLDNAEQLVEFFASFGWPVAKIHYHLSGAAADTDLTLLFANIVRKDERQLIILGLH